MLEHHQKGERDALREGDRRRFWDEWGLRIRIVNNTCRWMISTALRLMCYATGTPHKNGGRVLDMLGDYPLAARDMLLQRLSSVNAEWLRNWRGCGYWSVMGSKRV